MRVEYLISRAPGLGSLSGHVLLALGQKGLWIRKARPRFLRFHETTVRQGEGKEITLHRVAENLLWSESSIWTGNNDCTSRGKNSGNFLNCCEINVEDTFFWIYFASDKCIYGDTYIIFFLLRPFSSFLLNSVKFSQMIFFSMISKTCFTLLRYFIIPSLFSNCYSVEKPI